MERITAVRWRDSTGTGVEHLVLKEDESGIVAESVILSPIENGFYATGYRIIADNAWRTLKASVHLIGGSAIEVISDANGNWTDGSFKSLPYLKGAIDVDITATPFTNTLPIRRLRLPAMRSKEILVVYVSLPSLSVTAERQRYTCLVPDKRYRFDDIDSGFSRDIEVDECGLVTDYPGLFRRIVA